MSRRIGRRIGSFGPQAGRFAETARWARDLCVCVRLPLFICTLVRVIGARLPIVVVAVSVLISGAALASSLVTESAPTASHARAPQALGVEPSWASGTSSSGRLERFSLEHAMSHVRRLAGRIGTRVRAHSGERKAARYVAARFRSMGYRTDVNSFPVDDDRSRNVVAKWPASARYGIVLGAHMDTVP